MRPSDSAPALFFCLRATPFGPLAVVWSVYGGEPRIRRILLSRPGVSARQAVSKLFPGSRASACAAIDILCEQIRAFLNGAAIRFSLDAVRLDLCSPFQERVLRAEHAIPRGRVSTYGLIAEHLGHPNAARAVGRALATNPFPIVVPCHRAVRSDGALGGYQGGLKMKWTLLQMEGVPLRGADHIASQVFFYLEGDRTGRRPHAPETSAPRGPRPELGSARRPGSRLTSAGRQWPHRLGAAGLPRLHELTGGKSS